MLPRHLRLRSNREFRQLYREGRSWAHPAAILYTRPAPPGEKRIAVSTARRLGGAVARNRLRRRFMAVCRQLEAQLPTGIHLVFVARPEAAAMSPGDLTQAVVELLRRAGALRGREGEETVYRWPERGGRGLGQPGTPRDEETARGPKETAAAGRRSM